MLAVVGPTAIGKTALAIKLAQNFKTEIISADSRQFYKEMKIGTAVPSEVELSAAKHHFIQHISIKDNYSVGKYERDAIAKLQELFENKDIVIVVGGSGLYVDALVNGLDDFPEVDSSIREKLNERLKTNGLKDLQDELCRLDNKSYNTIALDNPHRVIRALEICIGSGKPYSTFLEKSKTKRPFKTIYIGLKADRNIIYKRINDRVDNMIANGLLEEAKDLCNYKSLNALNTVGYKELFKYLDKEISFDFAIEEIKKNTRRFAKRQLTWYRKNEDIIWFDYQDKLNVILENLKTYLK